MPRDEFSAEVKDTLAHRVGMRCSNPNCRQTTSGPRDDLRKALNVGVAAHISAASKGGPRYDSSLDPTERRSIENAVWLCQNCAKLIDNDDQRYTVDLLRQWKRVSEEAARLAIESPAAEPRAPLSDADLIGFFAQCFDRPAFQDPFRQEGSMEAFDKAIEDTITAINTGCLRSRDGGVLARGRGKAFLQNNAWRERMDVIVDILRAVRSRYESARKGNVIHMQDHPSGDSFYCFHDPMLADWMDASRAQVLQMFGEIAQEAGVRAPEFPRPRRRSW
jgi:hypothetical protein